MKKISTALTAFLLTLALALIPSGCGSGGVIMFLDGLTELNLYAGDSCSQKGSVSACQKEIHAFLNDFENKASVNIPSSEVAKFNSAKADEKIFLSDDVYNLFKISLDIYENTNGAFNFCLYDISLLWGFYPDNENFGIIPNGHDIDALLSLANPAYIRLDDDEKSALKTVNGVKVDFGGIAKGYALGRCAEIAKKHNVSGGTINIGGNVYAIGEYNYKGEKKLKKIAIRDPRFFENGNEYFCALYLNECSISVSGDYERFFINDGKRYCHIIDPQTGSPVNNGVISVVIADENAALADAYSTAVMVSGPEKGFALMEQKNLSGIIITSDKSYYVFGELNISQVYEGYEQKSLQ
jgi:thiamine biosynthesis lipoprotein